MNGESASGEVEGKRAGTESGDGCCSAVDHGLTEHDVEVDVRAFGALANETRYELLRLIDAAGEEVCACELVPELDVNQSTTSRALNALYEAGFVDRRKEGRWRYYGATERAEELLAAVDATREADS